jgi:hypothetical protein
MSKLPTCSFHWRPSSLVSFVLIYLFNLNVNRSEFYRLYYFTFPL